jgi:hypothetical protein
MLRLVTTGDANFSGTADFNDFLAMQNHYNQSSDWAGGDFDYSGVADFNDYLILQNNYNHSASVVPPANLQIGVPTLSATPAPTDPTSIAAAPTDNPAPAPVQNSPVLPIVTSPVPPTPPHAVPNLDGPPAAQPKPPITGTVPPADPRSSGRTTTVIPRVTLAGVSTRSVKAAAPRQNASKTSSAIIIGIAPKKRFTTKSKSKSLIDEMDSTAPVFSAPAELAIVSVPQSAASAKKKVKHPWDVSN